MTHDLVVTEFEGAVAVLSLNRPEARNALSTPMVRELTDTLGALAEDERIAVVVITGGESHFAAGADLAELVDLDQHSAFLSEFTGCCAALGAFRKPVIAAVAGYALGGGCELVEMCDIVVASQGARFAHPEATLGTMPGSGGTQRLSRLAGKHRAMDLLLTGRVFDVAEAMELGLVSRSVPEGEAGAAARALAQELAANPAPVMMMIKEAVGFASSASLADGLIHERRLFHMSLASDDRKERMRAFLEKRRPADQSR